MKDPSYTWEDQWKEYLRTPRIRKLLHAKICLLIFLGRYLTISTNSKVIHNISKLMVICLKIRTSFVYIMKILSSSVKIFLLEFVG